MGWMSGGQQYDHGWGINCEVTFVNPFVYGLYVNSVHTAWSCSPFLSRGTWLRSIIFSSSDFRVLFLLIIVEILICNFIYETRRSLSGIRGTQEDWAGSAKLLFGATYTLTCATDSFAVEVLKAHEPPTAALMNTVMLGTL